MAASISLFPTSLSLSNTHTHTLGDTQRHTILADFCPQLRGLQAWPT